MRTILIWLLAGLMLVPVTQASPPQTRADCLIVAMEIDDRLACLTSQHVILGFKVWNTEKDVAAPGHALCAFKLSPNSWVFFYDADNGSIPLGTKEWDFYKIQTAINRLFMAAGVPRVVYDVEVMK